MAEVEAEDIISAFEAADVAGVLVMDHEGMIEGSSGDLDGDQEAAVYLRYLLLDTTGLLGSLDVEKEPLKSIQVKFSDCLYSVTLTKQYIVAVKRGVSDESGMNELNSDNESAGEIE